MTMPSANRRISVAVTSRATELRHALDRVRQARLFEAGNVLRNAILEELSKGPKTGRTYKVPGTRREYTASAPGESPARRTGDLARSIRVDPLKPSVITEFVEVGSELDYALYLELGTKNEDGSTRMEARPFIAPAAERVQDEIREILTRPSS